MTDKDVGVDVNGEACYSQTEAKTCDAPGYRIQRGCRGFTRMSNARKMREETRTRQL